MNDLAHGSLTKEHDDNDDSLDGRTPVQAYHIKPKPILVAA